MKKATKAWKRLGFFGHFHSTSTLSYFTIMSYFRRTTLKGTWEINIHYGYLLTGLILINTTWVNSSIHLRGHSITTWTKRGWGGSVESPRLITWQRVDIFWNVHNCPLKVGRGQNWVKFGPRSCWMTPKIIQRCNKIRRILGFSVIFIK